MILVIMGFIFIILIVSMGDFLKVLLEILAYFAAPAVIFVVNALADVTCEKKMNKQQRIRKDVIAMIIAGCAALLYILYMGYKKRFMGFFTFVWNFSRINVWLPFVNDCCESRGSFFA